MSEFDYKSFEQALQAGEFKYLEPLRTSEYLNVFRLKVTCANGGYGLELNKVVSRINWFYYFTPQGGYQLINPIDLPRYTIRFEELLERLSDVPEVQQELLFHLDLFKST